LRALAPGALRPLAPGAGARRSLRHHDARQRAAGHHLRPARARARGDRHRDRRSSHERGRDLPHRRAAPRAPGRTPQRRLPRPPPDHRRGPDAGDPRPADPPCREPPAAAGPRVLHAGAAGGDRRPRRAEQGRRQRGPLRAGRPSRAGLEPAVARLLRHVEPPRL
ncbi:MAG: hypothetical protein AVDCRST_MAG24-735, partial [uncultured Nocardioidaceae bacterium]